MTFDAFKALLLVWDGPRRVFVFTYWTLVEFQALLLVWDGPQVGFCVDFLARVTHTHTHTHAAQVGGMAGGFVRKSGVTGSYSSPRHTPKIATPRCGGMCQSDGQRVP